MEIKNNLINVISEMVPNKMHSIAWSSNLEEITPFFEVVKKW